eukprot:TRINITY_DN4028_c0_g2_i4.p2 TRINITY_DN4028_c0_g2~~TRINITY_DN4028_c0_g2_i4.p2  ORF type:complete len:194 (-),score=60.27 TRINITY_DN4028_c0_g2_i4:126-707(-)
MLEDATMESCLLSIIKSNIVGDNNFIKIVIQIRKSISSQVLNSLNSKLIELSKEGIMLTLFSLAINNAFTQVSPKEIVLPHKYIRQLVVLQQRKILRLQEELDSLTESQPISANEVVDKEEVKSITENKAAISMEQPNAKSEVIEAEEEKDAKTEKAKGTKKAKKGKEQKEEGFDFMDLPEKEDSDWDDYILL